MKIIPVGADYPIETDGKTDRDGEANSRPSQFCECA
jgi:hypothetical protein